MFLFVTEIVLSCGVDITGYLLHKRSGPTFCVTSAGADVDSVWEQASFRIQKSLLTNIIPHNFNYTKH